MSLFFSLLILWGMNMAWKRFGDNFCTVKLKHFREDKQKNTNPFGLMYFRPECRWTVKLMMQFFNYRPNVITHYTNREKILITPSLLITLRNFRYSGGSLVAFQLINNFTAFWTHYSISLITMNFVISYLKSHLGREKL
jgi:hypothetical protein